MPDETRILYFSVVDRHGLRLEGAAVRFYVKDKLKAEARQQRDSPIKFEISIKVEFVDVEVWYAEAHEWTKVSMADGSVEFTPHVSETVTSAQPTFPSVPVPMETPSPNSTPSQESSTPPWRAGAVWAAAITGLCAVLVGFWQYGPKSCSSPPSVKFRVKVLDYSTLAPVSNATVTLEDGVSQLDGFTDTNGFTKVFSLPKSSQANLSLSVNAENYARRSFNLDRPQADETYTAELKPMKSSPPGTSASESFAMSVPGTWTIQGIGDPNNERITSGTLTFVKQGDGKAVLTGHLHLDSMDVTLSGTCEWHGHEAHMAFGATTAQGGSWQGSSDLTADSARRLTGRLLSKRGDDVPLVLTKD